METRPALPPAGQAGFVLYADRYGLYQRDDYPEYRRVLETDWQAYLDGKVGFASAIRAMVKEL